MVAQLRPRSLFKIERDAINQEYIDSFCTLQISSLSLIQSISIENMYFTEEVFF